MKKRTVLFGIFWVLIFVLFIVFSGFLQSGEEEVSKKYNPDYDYCMTSEYVQNIDNTTEKSPAEVSQSIRGIIRQGYLLDEQIDRLYDILRKSNKGENGFIYNNDNRLYMELPDVEMAYHKSTDKEVVDLFLNKIDSLMLQKGKHSFYFDNETNDSYNKYWKIVNYVHYVEGYKSYGDYIQFVLNYDCSRDMVMIDKIKIYLRYMPFDFYDQQDSLTKIVSDEKELNKITGYADATIISGPEIYLMEYEGKNKLTAIYKARRGDKGGNLYIFSDGSHYFKEDVVHEYAGNIKIKIQYPDVKPPDYSQYNDQSAIMMNIGKKLWYLLPGGGGYCATPYNYVTDTDIGGYYSTSWNCSTTTHAIRPRGEYAVKDIKLDEGQYSPDYDWKYYWSSNDITFTDTSGDNFVAFLTAYSITHLGYMFEHTLGLSFSNQKAEFKPMHYVAPICDIERADGYVTNTRVHICKPVFTITFHEWVHAIQDMNYAFGGCGSEYGGLMGDDGWREGATYGLMRTFNTWLMQQDPNRKNSSCNDDYYSGGAYISWKYPNDWNNNGCSTNFCRNCDFFKFLYDRIKFVLGPIRGLKNILASFHDISTEISPCPTFSTGDKSHYKAMNNYDSGNSVMPFITQVFREHVDDSSVGFGSGIDELPGIFSGAILYKSNLGSTSVKPQTQFSSLGLLPGFDVDYLSFWANAGESYTIAVSSSIQMCIVAYQADTSYINSTCGSNPTLNITGPGNEQNFVNVKIYKRYSSDTGTTYTVNISSSDDYGDNITNATPIPIRSGNGGRKGKIETSGDYDYFSVYVPVNNAVVTFTTSAGDSPAIGDTVIKLYNGLGTLLACNDDIGNGNYYSRIITDNSGGQGLGECSGSGVPNNPAQLSKGWYVIAVKGYSAYTGGYTIKAEISGNSDIDQADSSGVLRSDTYYGRRIASSFESSSGTSNDVDDYRVSLNAGDVIMISAIPLSSGVDTVVDILTANNNPTYKSYTVNSRRVMIRDDDGRTGWDSGGSELRFVAPVTSDYIIRVFPSGVSPDSRYSASEQSASGSGTTGDYELDIRWYPESDEQINPEME